MKSASRNYCIVRALNESLIGDTLYILKGKSNCDNALIKHAVDCLKLTTQSDTVSVKIKVDIWVLFDFFK